MGTVCYMLPEQDIGQPLDLRSDQFSTGPVAIGGMKPLLLATVANL